MLNKRFTAKLEKSLTKRGMDVRSMARICQLFRHARTGKGSGHDRRDPIRKFVHGTWRWYSQAPGEIRDSPSHKKEVGDTVAVHLEERILACNWICGDLIRPAAPPCSRPPYFPVGSALCSSHGLYWPSHSYALWDGRSCGQKVSPV